MRRVKRACALGTNFKGALNSSLKQFNNIKQHIEISLKKYFTPGANHNGTARITIMSIV